MPGTFDLMMLIILMMSMSMMNDYFGIGACSIINVRTIVQYTLPERTVLVLYSKSSSYTEESTP